MALLRERAKEEVQSSFCVLNKHTSVERRAAGYISDAGNASFWNVDYYQHHFDIDTKTVSPLSQSITLSPTLGDF